MNFESDGTLLRFLEQSRSQKLPEAAIPLLFSLYACSETINELGRKRVINFWFWFLILSRTSGIWSPLTDNACALGTRLFPEQLTRRVLTNCSEDLFSDNQVRQETNRDSDHVTFPALALSCDRFIFLLKI